MPYYVYILASGKNGTLYTGVTNDVPRRTTQHREGTASAFTKKYRVHRLVYMEVHEEILEAIAREKTLKRWRRAWKSALIEQANPNWRDLYGELNQ
jgi:putative endonuclease